jgi:hypothetical protein
VISRTNVFQYWPKATTEFNLIQTVIIAIATVCIVYFWMEEAAVCY